MKEKKIEKQGRKDEKRTKEDGNARSCGLLLGRAAMVFPCLMFRRIKLPVCDGCEDGGYQHTYTDAYVIVLFLDCCGRSPVSSCAA
ncbi:hypothetical protein NDU88_000260 [Pleurodeles waltl]|uniref:Uncharacterized protein n=1 Tax=Pleurodeles waltl TaxID=8319 RepID=A0AAV7MH78_PLEWA|nr:hypothetical protein NDU88_000260 [Pleurodeles waltl]